MSYVRSVSIVAAILGLIGLVSLPVITYKEGVKVGKSLRDLEVSNDQIDQYKRLYETIKAQHRRDGEVVEKIETVSANLHIGLQEIRGRISRQMDRDCAPGEHIVRVYNAAKKAESSSVAVRLPADSNTRAKPSDSQ